MRRRVLQLLFASLSACESTQVEEVSTSADVRIESAEPPVSGSYPAPPINFSSPQSAAAVTGDPIPELPARCAAEPPVLIRRPTLTDDQLRAALKDGTSIVGSASLGEPNKGALFAGVELVPNEALERAGKHGFGTELAVRSIERAAREVARCHPGGPKVHVGDISAQRGGWISPHRSHQSGLDADIGFYYVAGDAWYVAPTKEMLDVVRTWAFLRALVEGGSVELVFIDLRIQRMLYEAAKGAPPQGWKLDDVFDLGHEKDKLLRHEPGHATHFHVRFMDPWAKAMGARVVKVDPTGALRGGTKTAKPSPAKHAKPGAPKPKPKSPGAVPKAGAAKKPATKR